MSICPFSSLMRELTDRLLFVVWTSNSRLYRKYTCLCNTKKPNIYILTFLFLLTSVLLSEFLWRLFFYDHNFVEKCFISSCKNNFCFTLSGFWGWRWCWCLEYFLLSPAVCGMTGLSQFPWLMLVQTLMALNFLSPLLPLHG